MLDEAAGEINEGLPAIAEKLGPETPELSDAVLLVTWGEAPTSLDDEVGSPFGAELPTEEA